MRMNVVSVVGTLLGLGFLFVGGEPLARAEVPKNPVPIAAPAAPVISVLAPQNCAVVTADQTVKVIDGIETFSQKPYGQQANCSSFVVDFTIDASAFKVTDPKYAPLLLSGWDSVREVQQSNQTPQIFASKVTKAQCASYKHNIMVWRKGPRDRGFEFFGGGDLTPSWNEKGIGWGPVCMLNPSATYKMIPEVTKPGPGVVETYRVAIYVSGAPGQMIASAMHPQ